MIQLDTLEEAYFDYLAKSNRGDETKHDSLKDLIAAIEDINDYDPVTWKPSTVTGKVFVYECIKPLEIYDVIKKSLTKGGEVELNEENTLWLDRIFRSPTNKIIVGDMLYFDHHYDRECRLTHYPHQEHVRTVLLQLTHGKDFNAKNHFIPLFQKEMVRERMIAFINKHSNTSFDYLYKGW
jgi:hypothetical protein